MTLHTFTALSAIVLASCDSSAGGPNPPVASIEVENEAGEHTARRCTRLPVLLGSHTQDNLDLGGEFAVILFTSNDALDVALVGASFESGGTHSVSAEELRAGYAVELVVTSDGGERFLLHLTSGCPS